MMRAATAAKPWIPKEVRSLSSILLFNVSFFFFHSAILLKLLNFLDPPSIIRISEGVIVNSKEDATLFCTTDANPLDENTITWKRDDFPKFSERTSIVYDKNGTSYLRISQVTREDLGNFQCIADNGIGNATVKNVMLIIKRKLCTVL